MQPITMRARYMREYPWQERVASQFQPPERCFVAGNFLLFLNRKDLTPVGVGHRLGQTVVAIDDARS